MVISTRNRPAPNVFAAASSPGSIASRESRMARTIKGKAITALANAAPCQLNAIEMSKCDFSQSPSGPFRLNSTSSR